MNRAKRISPGRLVIATAIFSFVAAPGVVPWRLMAQQVDRIAPSPANVKDAPPDAKPLKDGSIVDGTVVDEQGKPVVGASVTALTGADGRVDATTDGAGRFRLTWTLPPLAIGPPRMIRASHANGRQGIATWAHQPSFQIVLKPPRDLTVVALDAEGTPVEAASVAVQVGQMLPALLASGQTDATGRWTAKIPIDAMIDQVVVLKSGVGFDHFSTLNEPRGVERRPLPDRVELKLDGARTVRVKAVDSNGEPLAGVSVSPFRLRKHEQADSVVLLTCASARSVTDTKGIAAIDWLPLKGGVAFMGTIPGYRSVNIVTNLQGSAPEGATADVTIQFVRESKILGRVAFTDGRPAGNIRIRSYGVGTRGSTGGQEVSRADGSYELTADPAFAYVIHVEDNRWAALSHVGVIVPEGEDLSGIDFTLQDGTIVRGRVTVGPDDRPVPNYSIFLIMKYGDIPPQLRAPGGPIPQLSSAYSTTTDAEGNFQFCLAAGTYELGGGGGILKPVVLRVAQEREIVHDIHVPRIPSDPANARGMGTVVDNEKRPVGGAVISGAPRSPVFKYAGFTLTRPDGRFEFTSTLIPLVFHARTSDGLLAGIARIETQAQPPTVRLDRAATAHGRLLDDKGQIAAGQRLRYGVVVREDEAGKSSASDTLVVDTVTTGSDGRFELRALVPGEEFVFQYEPEPQSNRWLPLTTIKAVVPEAFNVGDLRLPVVD